MRVLSLLMGICLLIGASPALADHHKRGHGPGRDGFGPPISRFADELELDAETLARIEETAARSRDEGMALHAEIRTERMQLRELLAVETPDLGGVLAQADVISALEAEALRLRLSNVVAIRNMLTPEQRKKLVELMDQKRAQHEERRAQKLADLKEVCAAEIEANCADAPDHPHALKRCLRRVESISPECAEQLRAQRRPGKEGHGKRF